MPPQSQPGASQHDELSMEQNLINMRSTQMSKIMKLDPNAVPSEVHFDRCLKYGLPVYRKVEITSWSLKNCTAGLPYEELRLGSYITEKNGTPLASYAIRHIMAGIPSIHGKTV